MNVEAHQIWHELQYMSWDDYDDFETKYGSDNNPDNFAKRSYFWYMFENIGHLLKRDYLDDCLLFDAFGPMSIMAWSQWEAIFIEQRKRYFGPTYFEGFEYLANRMTEVQKSRGIEWEPPSTGIRFHQTKLRCYRRSSGTGRFEFR